jgi:hypothetical protein
MTDAPIESKRVQLGPNDHCMVPVAEAFVGLGAPTEEALIHIQFRMRGGAILDIPLTREAHLDLLRFAVQPLPRQLMPQRMV